MKSSELRFLASIFLTCGHPLYLRDTDEWETDDGSYSPRSPEQLTPHLGQPNYLQTSPSGQLDYPVPPIITYTECALLFVTNRFKQSSERFLLSSIINTRSRPDHKLPRERGIQQCRLDSKRRLGGWNASTNLPEKLRPRPIQARARRGSAHHNKRTRPRPRNKRKHEAEE